MSEELKPCPFCGAQMMPRDALWPSDGDTDAIIHAQPTECGMQFFTVETADQGVTVAAAWNTRVPDPRQLVEQRDEALRDVALWQREAADRSQGLVELNLDRAAQAVEISQIVEQRDALAESLHALRRVMLPIEMTLAQAECVDEPLADSAVILSFMGSGASDQVTAGEYREAMRKGAAALAALEQGS